MSGLARRLFLAVLLAGCGGGGGAGPGRELTVLAGSELKDIEPYLKQIRKQTGVSLDLQYSGTLAGIDRLNAGESFDAVWFSHAKYLILSDAGRNRVKAQEKIMLSPVILGVRESKARAFGWVNNPEVTWADVAAKVRAGVLRYAMTNPTASNSGFSAVIGVTAALSRSTSALTSADINTAALKDFFQGQALTAGSSGWLAESYVRDQDRLDGMINYESILLSLNRGGQLREPLVLIYPKEGIVTADYPLVLLNEAKRDAYTRLVQYLRGADFQRTLMSATFRRPVNPDVRLDPVFPRSLIIELPFPADLAVVDGILDSYLSEQRRPAHSYFLLDVSGSMHGPRLAQLQAALNTLAGDDSSITGRFARFQPRERVTVLTFSDRLVDHQSFELGTAAQAPRVRTAIKQYAAGLGTGGRTAIFSSLEATYREALAARGADPQRYFSIVLMTDGESNMGETMSDFRRFYLGLPRADQDIKVFPILFGEAKPEELQAIATMTGGRMFNGTQGGLASLFKEIRGYQ
ncbi:MAG TPA: substrate-binding domain-containing protein [Gemmatimonadales bacterium]|jgi:Ca-activated chloride channel family protein